MRDALGWARGAVVASVYSSGASLAFAAAPDQLFTATEVNEWAWQVAAVEALRLPLPHAPGHPATWDADSALHTLRLLAAGEACPVAMALVEQARRHKLPALFDEDGLSIGAGHGCRSWTRAELQGELPEVEWEAVRDVPTVLVTGSNGKTTTVRLLAAMAAAAGLAPGFNCTDGVFIAGEQVEQGDYSGPAGARTVLRDQRVHAAILETARGGILRRGLATSHANAAIITNVSADHFGEYGVHDLSSLAAAKLVVARAIGSDGVLVVNADDGVLSTEAATLDCPLAWFSLDALHPILASHRKSGGATCGIADGILTLHVSGVDHALGTVGAMPLTFGGAATYNIANVAGAALAAACIGLPIEAIARVLSNFGAVRTDNPGRLERWQVGGSQVLLDYAHNPEGLTGLLAVAADIRARSGGRLGLLLGQAGNRDEEAIRALARSAASARPDFIVLKDLEGYLRGREVGEVPAILHSELALRGIAESSLLTVLPEVAAAQAMLAWARPGDVVVLPVHSLAARAELVDWLDARQVG